MSASKENDVIVLDDDDDDEDDVPVPSVVKSESLPVIDLVGGSLQGNSKCINYACASGKDMISAPIFCISYYRVKRKRRKDCRICSECYNKALKFYDDMAVRLIEGDNLVEVDVPFRNDLVEIDDSDEDDEECEDEDGLCQADIDFIDENIDDVINEIEKFNIPAQQKALDLKLNEDCDLVSEELKDHCNKLKSIRKELDAICTGLYSQFQFRYYHLEPVDICEEDDGRELSNNDVIIVEEPKDLPLKGTFNKPPLKIGETYYVPHNSIVGCPWMKVMLQKVISPEFNSTYEVVPICPKFKKKQHIKFVIGKDLAYSSPAPVLLDVGTRVIAVFTYTNNEVNSAKNTNNSNSKQLFYAGIVAEYPTALSNYRYLIFFDDGYAHYVQYHLVYPVFESSKDVWDDINGESKTFIKKYLSNYPNRPMVKFKKHQKVSTEYNGSWWTTTILDIDCSLVLISFDLMERKEWIYRGSTRLRPMFNEEQAAVNRLQNNKRTPKFNTNSNSTPYVQYINDESALKQHQPQRAVSRKSTTNKENHAQNNNNKANDNLNMVLKRSKIVYYTPKRQKPNTQIYQPHRCGPFCKDFVSCNLRRLVSYNPLAKPLLSGFHRLLYKFRNRKHVVYKAPCGRILRNMPELHHYLRLTDSPLSVDFFNFEVHIRCLAEFYLDEDIQPLNKDLSCGQEEVPITVMNYIDNELIDFCNYSTRREPMEGVNLNLDPNFLCGCDCEDDCVDKSKCSCWQLTLGGMKFLQQNNPSKVGYVYRRLMEPVYTGIYECNVMCRCKKTCLNRVVQHPLQHKLQVFKTPNRGWGIRCINDIPQGAFICIYAGALLTEQMANEGGQCYGDEYFAELDYIEVVEKMKEDYEAEVVGDDIDSKTNPRARAPSENSAQSSEESEDDMDTKKEAYEYDRDFVPSVKKRVMKDISLTNRINLRKRDRSTFDDKDSSQNGTVTISDDEDDVVREPSSFNPKAQMDENDTNSNSVRLLFGKNERVYIMDAKSTGNIGRFLNHSCSPNVFVQNVFVDTHDLRFPWVAFFAMSYIRAGTELTWNYQYDVGSVAGKNLPCLCNSSACKGRLL